MSFTVTRRTFLAGSAAAAGTAALGMPGRAFAAEPLAVAFVYTGPIGDHGYTYAHDVGRKAVEAHFGDKVKVTFVENVPEGPDCERVIRQLATAGNQLIFATSFGFMEPTLKVAKQFPKIKFEHATGFKRAPNVAIYNIRWYEGRYVMGDIAGRMSKAGVAGYVASFPIPEVVMGINAFTLAAQKQNPNFKTKVIWANTWYDPGKESDAAKALIDKGADIIVQHTDSAAPLQVAEARGVLAFGQATDMHSFAPKAHLTALVDKWDNYYIDRVQKVIDGTWTSSDTWWGLKEGLVELSPYNESMPADVKASADKLKADISSGVLHPFTGPIKNQKGEIVYADGKKATDEDMLKMNWYVQGVES
jgi:simple sugar transport system substrate-binding protein